MPLHLGLPHSDSQEAAREVRRLLQSKVRNDWAFPAAGDRNFHDLGGVCHDAGLGPQTQAPVLTFEPTGWKEREYSSSDSDASDQSEPDSAGAEGVKYKFDSPELVGETVAGQAKSRKRKRQQMLEDEMGWNVGLAHFLAQRNAWTCARVVAAQDIHKQPNGFSNIGDTLESKEMLPIPPKLMPEHPVRARINSSTYSEIYSKVILQARTPTVPINLSHVTRALIHGWKEEGNWPPKGAAAEAPISKKKSKNKSGTNGESPKHPHLRKGVQAVGRVLGLGIANGHAATNGQKEVG